MKNVRGEIYVTWKDFEHAIQTLCSLLEGEKIDVIYGIARGGLPLAVALSNRLNLQMITNIEELDNIEAEDKLNALVVDEISDEGKTLAKSVGLLLNHPKIRFVKVATWFKRNGSMINPHFFVKEVKQNDWVVFPWEVEQKE